ncbi:MAG: hypothetical protein ABJE80_07615 [Reichenbachiella sp.]|uniref:hypothetical protein n=1 Tax=Reichenbachiella sp. TaxID=2184521 RepID=UPI003265BF6A
MKTKTTMLEYCKKVLEAVSFDQELFMKEYHKSLSWLNSDESVQLTYWIRNESQSGFENLKRN